MCHITGLGAVFGIGGDKTTCIGVAVTSVEVVKAQFGIVVIPTIAEGVEAGEVGASDFSNSILPRRAGAVNRQPKAGRPRKTHFPKKKPDGGAVGLGFWGCWRLAKRIISFSSFFLYSYWGEREDRKKWLAYRNNSRA